MKLFSEITGKLYDTQEELEAAEAKFAKNDEMQNDKSDVVPDSKEDTKALTKKQLATKVEEADKRLQEAKSNLEIANQQVEQLSQEYLKRVDEILNPAKQEVKDAQKARYDAIKEFNREYGAYQVSYTGDRAAQEMLAAIRDLNNVFRRSFWF